MAQDKATKAALDELRKTVEQEIQDHPKWCRANCNTFLTDAYRRARIIYKLGAKTVQKQYDLCHIWR